MSKVGKRLIVIPVGTIVNWDSVSVSVKGPGGELKKKLFLHDFNLELEGGSLKIFPKSEALSKRLRSLWGTYSSIISNMVSGVNKPYEKILEFEGVGYRAEVSGSDLVLNLGFSHPVKLKIPEGQKLTVGKNNIVVSGIDKEAVGIFAAKIRKIRKVEPYKGTGIKYQGEIVKRKAGKKVSG